MNDMILIEFIIFRHQLKALTLIVEQLLLQL